MSTSEYSSETPLAIEPNVKILSMRLLFCKHFTIRFFSSIQFIFFFHYLLAAMDGSLLANAFSSSGKIAAVA
jgi:hypothetical protein